MERFQIEDSLLIDLYKIVLQINKKGKEICFFEVSPHVNWIHIRVAESAQYYNNIVCEMRFYYRQEWSGHLVDDILREYHDAKKMLLQFL